MPYTVKFDQLPMGRAAAAARAEDRSVSVRYIEFASSEDGQEFMRCLEGFPQDILSLLDKQCGVSTRPSAVDHLLAIIQRNRTTTVYLNELQFSIEVLPTRPIKAGEKVFGDDIADVGRMDLGGVRIPSDCGVLFLFSVGWRRGLFYDFGPLNPIQDVRRGFDCEALFGELYARVAYQERFSILECEWESLFAAKLFPFVGLRRATIDRILAHIRSGWDPAELTDVIVREVKERVPSFVDGWRRRPAFQPHMVLIERAADRLANDDWMSCSTILFPRIEGILRSHHLELGREDKPGQSNLADSAVASKVGRTTCLFLPHKFREYLRRVYFAHFSPESPPCSEDIDLSRHSVAHGTAPPEAFSPLAAVVAFLILHQLFYLFRPPPPETDAEDLPPAGSPS